MMQYCLLMKPMIMGAGPSGTAHGVANMLNPLQKGKLHCIDPTSDEYRQHSEKDRAC